MIDHPRWHRLARAGTALALSACGAASPPTTPPAPARAPEDDAAACPPAPPVSTAPIAERPARPIAPRVWSRAGGGRLLWEEHFFDGDVTLVANGLGGVFVLPLFLGTAVEGDTYGLLDAAGDVVWTASAVVGFRGGAIDGGGRLHALPVVPLKGPHADEAYGSHTILRSERSGRPVTWTLGGQNVDAEEIKVDRLGNVVVRGRYRGAVRFGRDVLRATAHEPRSFLLRLDPSGKPLWARDVAEGTGYDVDRAEGTILLERQGEELVLVRLAADANESWRRKVPASKGCAEAVTGPWLDGAGRMRLLSSKPCFGNADSATIAYVVAELDADARLHRVYGVPLEDGMTEGVAIAFHDSGAMALATPSRVLEISADGELAWRAPLDHRCLSKHVGAVAIDDASVFVSAGCEGAREGTMLGNPYSRAYARSNTYVARYARR